MRHAVLKNCVEVVRYLIFAGVNLDFVLRRSVTPSHVYLTTVGSQSLDDALRRSFTEILDLMPVYPERFRITPHGLIPDEE